MGWTGGPDEVVAECVTLFNATDSWNLLNCTYLTKPLLLFHQSTSNFKMCSLRNKWIIYLRGRRFLEFCLADVMSYILLFSLSYKLDTTSVFGKSPVSHILASVCFPPHTVRCKHTHTSSLPLRHSHTHKGPAVPVWSEYPMVHCNGTSRWSLIGSGRWASPRRRRRAPRHLAARGCLRCWDSFSSCFCISSSCEEKMLNADTEIFKGNKGNWVDLFSLY